MSVILVFIVSLIAVAFWWLLRHGLMSKPWLETGPSPALGPAPGPLTERVGLGIFLVVIATLFVLFGSAFVMRMDLESWQSLTLPPIVWANTAQLVLASLFLHMAAGAARRGDRNSFRRDATVAALATAGFLVGQLLAWRELTASGDGLTTGPAASFFYMLSGLHGLHILGGLGALAFVSARGREHIRSSESSIGLCAAYWNFLLVVWIGLLALFLGWANQLIDICRGVLT